MPRPLRRSTGVVAAALTLSAAGCFALPPDACLSNNGGCDPHAACTSDPKGSVVCTCKSGFAGDGHTCDPSCVNVCDSSMSQCGCSANATCVVADAGPACQCNAGFAGDGFSCFPGSVPVACGTVTCSPEATCSTSGGSPECVCNAGFAGDGLSCTRRDGIGATCADSTAHQQSTCDANLICVQISTQNMCSMLCTTDADCSSDTINTLPAACLEGLCFPSCNPLVPSDSCVRDDLICNSSALDHNICLPNCQLEGELDGAGFCEGFFGYPFTQCNDADGSCLDEAPCGSANPCGAGEECVATSLDSAPVSICVQDCTTTASTSCTQNQDCLMGACVSGVCQSCPFGTTCDAAMTLTCQPVPVDNYEECQAQAQCPDSPVNLCVQLGPTPIEGPSTQSLCLQECSTSSDCLPGQTCALSVGDTEVCVLECPSGTGCPAGTTCQALQNAGDLCLP